VKSENDMTDEELERHEKQTEVKQDRWDDLDKLRKLLNSSRVEQMYVLKRTTSLGPLCPYFIKSKRLFQEQEEKQILSMMEQILRDFNV
jgi:hypothetical protein